MTEFVKARVRPPRTFDCTFTAVMTGDPGPVLAFWPAELQDRVYEAMERCLKANDIARADITFAKCTLAFGNTYNVRITITEILSVDDVEITKGTVH